MSPSVERLAGELRAIVHHDALGKSALPCQPSNRRLPDELRSRAVEIVRDHYLDFGPTLACEKLLELHDLRVSKETLRAWLIGAGIWIPRRERVRTAHQGYPNTIAKAPGLRGGPGRAGRDV